MHGPHVLQGLQRGARHLCCHLGSYTTAHRVDERQDRHADGHMWNVVCSKHTVLLTANCQQLSVS
jgi:hypothetical protein